MTDKNEIVFSKESEPKPIEPGHASGGPVPPPREYVEPELVFKKKKKIAIAPKVEEIISEDLKESEPDAISSEIKEVEAGAAVTPTLEKVKQKKRIMSEKQLENLAKARAKAAETRAKNKALKEAGEPVLTKKKKKELEVKKQHLEEFVLLSEANKAIREPIKEPPTINNITNNFTEEDIANIAALSTKKALDNYEEKRKQRKLEKQKLLQQQNANKMFKEQISRAAYPNTSEPRRSYRVSDPDFWESSGFF